MPFSLKKLASSILGRSPLFLLFLILFLCFFSFVCTLLLLHEGNESTVHRFKLSSNAAGSQIWRTEKENSLNLRTKKLSFGAAINALNLLNETAQAFQNDSLTTLRSVSKKKKSFFSRHVFERDDVESFLQIHGSHSIRRTLAAYIEPPLQDIVPGTGSRGNMKDSTDFGTPPEFVIPLPLRTRATPNNLVKYTYPKVQTCHDMPGSFPVDRGLQTDPVTGKIVRWNTGIGPTSDDWPLQEAPYCPVEMDPFLPWIHDVFPSVDGSRIEFVAQNKRRCRTGSQHTADVNRLVPQVALMQPVSVQRIDDETARRLAPELWYPGIHTTEEHNSKLANFDVVRYRLAPRNESDRDGQNTRFICRFHATKFSNNQSHSVFVGETLSAFPFNYEFVAFRKPLCPVLLTTKGKDSNLFWTSTFLFNCPVPNHVQLRKQIASGDLVLSDGTPTLYVDLVPIRTSARYTDMYLTDNDIGPEALSKHKDHRYTLSLFDPRTRWGPRNVLPRVEASGRWENIPVCWPPHSSKAIGSNSNQFTKTLTSTTDTKLADNNTIANLGRTSNEKPQYLSACLWSSAEYLTRGTSEAHIDTSDRLVEWVEFHLLVGFDHIYLYDNSKAHTNASSLRYIVDLFPGKITRIEWPSIICNNNVPASDSPGERSSQYAAENSCRTRFAPFNVWLAVIDTDEYLIPMGNFSDIKQVLRQAELQGTKVLSFRSSRGKLRRDKASECEKHQLEKLPNATFLEAYNCDSGGIPKPSWAERARKQIYQTDYVLNHFVHYSTVTQSILQTWAEAKQAGQWYSSQYYSIRGVVERYANEVNEAVMVHAKTIRQEQTRRYQTICHKDYLKKWQSCFVAYPWPNVTVGKGKVAYNADGMLYNCFVNEKVEQHWVPILRTALQKRAKVGKLTSNRL